MTDQGKINRAGAKPASLFERADATFGLGPLNGAPKVPAVPPVPETLRRAHDWPLGSRLCGASGYGDPR